MELEIKNSINIIKNQKEIIFKKLNEKELNENERIKLVENIKELDNIIKEYYLDREKSKIYLYFNLIYSKRESNYCNLQNHIHIKYCEMSITKMV